MESTARLHPLLTAAAVSVIALSVAGVAAVTGILPTSVGSIHSAAPVPAPVAALPPVQAPAAKPRPVKKVAWREAAPEHERAPLPQAPLVLTHPQAQAPASRPICFDCGTVEAVREIEEKGQGSWIGPVAGGVGGAILGKQMGKGNGNTIMTILGAAGGAFVGNEIEKRVRTTKRWEVSVRLEDGSMRTVPYDTAPGWRTGERVRFVNGTIVPEQRVQS